MRFQTLFPIAVLVSLFALAPGSSYGQSQPAAETQQPAAASVPPPPPKHKPLP
jgi:hypothetical protein